jgi:hypothetical protein
MLKQVQACYSLHADVLFGFLFKPEDEGDRYLPNTLQGLICQKIELFVTTAMRTSNPTK